MTAGGMRRYITYRAMITGDQQHTCQAARWWDAARSFVQSATASSVGTGVRRHLERTDAARCEGRTGAGCLVVRMLDCKVYHLSPFGTFRA